MIVPFVYSSKIISFVNHFITTSSKEDLFIKKNKLIYGNYHCYISGKNTFNILNLRIEIINSDSENINILYDSCNKVLIQTRYYVANNFKLHASKCYNRLNVKPSFHTQI